MKYFSVLLFCVFAVANTPSLESGIRGNWKLISMSCNGQPQTLDKSYELLFDGKKGAYVSKTPSCTQVEPEDYRYLSDRKITIKSGVRKCVPSPCAADLPASECGKETNVNAAQFDVKLEKETLVLSTNDPKAIDCTGQGQSKPALFVFSRQK